MHLQYEWAVEAVININILYSNNDVKCNLFTYEDVKDIFEY